MDLLFEKSLTLRGCNFSFRESVSLIFGCSESLRPALLIFEVFRMIRKYRHTAHSDHKTKISDKSLSRPPL